MHLKSKTSKMNMLIEITRAKSVFILSTNNKSFLCGF